MAIGETAEFECRHPTADYIGWKVNDSSILSNVSFMNISTASYSVRDGPSRNILIVGAIPTYNGTVVICVAVFIAANNCPSQDSRPAVLLIQGRCCQR